MYYNDTVFIAAFCVVAVIECQLLERHNFFLLFHLHRFNTIWWHLLSAYNL